LSIGSYTLIVSNNVTISSGGDSNRIAQVSLSTGTISITGTISFSGTQSSAYLTFTGPGTINLGGNLGSGGTFIASSGTVNCSGASQTIAPYVFNNLTLSGSGTKTLTSGLTVNGVLSMEGSAIASGTPTYGGDAILQYNTSIARNTGPEWPATFSTTGGVVIMNTGTITLGATKTFSNSPLKVFDGSSLSTGSTGSYSLTNPNPLILYCGGTTSGSTISGSGILTLGGDVTVLDAGNSTAGAIISCPVALGDTRVFTVADGGTDPATDMTVSGIVSGPDFGLTKAGVGTMVLSGTNSFSGAVTINAGILSVNTVAATGSSSSLGTGSATSTISISGSGTLRYTGSGHSTNRAITLTGSGATIDASGEDALILSGTISGSGNNLVLTGSGIGIKNNPINISTSTLTKSGSGIWTLSGNNVIGPVSVTNGILKLGTGGPTTFPLGNSTSATTVNDGATLDLNGYSTVEPLILNGDGFSSGGALANTVGNLVFAEGNVFLGSNSTFNTNGSIDISGVISGNYAMTKEGSGILYFSGINTFSGGLIINSGTVQLNFEGCLADNLPVTLAGGSLATGEPGITEKVGTLSVTNTSTIVLGSGVHSLTFDDSHELTWSGTALLEVTGWAGNGLSGGTAGKILIGVDGLTSTQLSQFRFDGYNQGADLLNGEVVPPYQNTIGDYQSSATGNWNTNTTWERYDGSSWVNPAPSAPIATSLVLIRNEHTVTVDGAADAGQIIIEDEATLTLSSSGQATAGTITNFGTLNLNSDAGGIASLIVDSYADYGDENIQLYLTGGGIETNYPWHYISTPIEGLSTTTVMTGGGSDGNDLVEYDETIVGTSLSQHAAWMGYDGWDYQVEDYSAPGFGTLTLGKGYNYYSYSTATRVFSGTFNTSDVTDILLSYSGPGDNPDIYGWNLVGNPFTASIFWDDIDRTFAVDNAIYFTTNNTYVTYVAGVGVPGGTTGNIPPMQGFFVKANAANQYIYFYSADRRHSAQNRYKGEAESIPLIRLKLGNEVVSDETAIRFDKSANLEFDHNLDAYKFSKTGTKVSLWSNSDKISYSINSIPYPETEIEIPLGINVSEDGSFKLNATQIEDLGDYGIFLTDKTTGTSVNLRTSPEFSFSASAGINENRFVIKIINLTTNVENPGISTDKFNIYSTNGFINIQTLSEEWNGKNGSVGIVDITGRIISLDNNMEFWKNSLIQIPAERLRGVYFIKIESGLMKHIGKVMIR
jgi:autotransporter-associated beta strand protein